MQMNADLIALTFNQQNERKSWKARPDSRPSAETVHFKGTHGMIELVYDVWGNRFAVRFNKVHAAWGDYIRAISRGLYIVLSTLKSGGLPFDCPDEPEGCKIECTVLDGSDVYVSYVADPKTVAEATMPELTVTGRVPTKPNIQNIPIRTETGAAIRQAFVDALGVPPVMDAPVSDDKPE